MAALLDSVTVEVGGTWWVHHGANRTRFPRHDPRRNWEEGTIIEITETELVVELLGTAAAQDPRRRHLQKSCSCSSSEQLLRRARSELRCVDWKSLVRYKDELFFGAVCSGNPFYASRPVKEGEEIDFFVSHSWHDDSNSKWAALEVFVRAFYEQRHRYPTFWFDKACIDQSKIRENLKVLPINLMSCAKMVVIAGRTYPRRLWCAWELLTLFAFTDEAHAVERVEVLSLDAEAGACISGSQDGENCDGLASLQAFDIEFAHCYDPNEEAKFRAVIDAVGADRFNERIRALGAAISLRKARAARHGSLDPGLSYFSSKISRVQPT